VITLEYVPALVAVLFALLCLCLRLSRSVRWLRNRWLMLGLVAAFGVLLVWQPWAGR
jgi:hypothetical protein